MRGDSEYMVGDATAGAVNATGNYAVENRCRLAGAGGSAYGMMAGAALLGPVGFVAGSLIGGAAAKTGMTALTGDPKKGKQRIEAQSQYSASNPSATAEQQQLSQSVYSNHAPDFFSYDNHTHAPPPGGGFQRQANHQRAAQSNAHQQQRQSMNASQNHFQQSQSQAYDNASAPTASAGTGNGSRYPAQQPYHQVKSRTASNTHAPTASQTSRANNEQQGYQFGDLTRGVVAKGKAARGDENSGYKFGDFTRGLFK